MTTSRLPGPPGIFTGLPNAIIDLNADAGAELVKGQWRYHDAEVVTVEFRSPGEDGNPTGPPNQTYDIVPHAQGLDFDDSGWETVTPTDLGTRRSTGKVCFNWYRINVTIPEKVGNFDPTGSTAVYDVVIDDYAEIWVNGEMPRSVGQAGGTVVGGFNSPNRIILARNVRPGQQFVIALFGINGPISASPENFVFMRTATLEFYADDLERAAREVPFEISRRDPALDDIVRVDAKVEKVAGDFVFTDGPVWSHAGFLFFSSPNTNKIYRWAPDGTVNVFPAKSAYRGFDIGEYTNPGSSGLTLDTEGRLAICEQGNRRIIQTSARGDVVVMADRYQDKRLNSPHDLVYKSDGSLYFTDPPFGLPQTFSDPRRELPFSGVFRVHEEQVVLLTDELTSPTGLAFSPDEKFLYVGNRDRQKKVVMRYPVNADGTLSPGEVFQDMTEAPGEDGINGIKIDQEGNLYVCGPGGVWILSPQGQVLGLIKGPEQQHNLAWGDEDGRTLYMTAITGIYRIALNIPGIRP
ncbi:MAG: gluconolactonase [Planctomyces sp.]|nr:gluconolactonase [Planctomyces sp.]